MLRFLVYLLFLLSVAFASSGIVLSIRLRNRLKTDCFSSLMYHQAFIYAFGFYGIWGQIVIKTFLTEFVSSEAITRISDISVLLGLPFIVLGWMMLIKFSMEISGWKINNLFIVLFLALNLVLIFGLGYFTTGNPAALPKYLERYYFIILSLVYTIWASLSILIPSGKSGLLPKKENRVLVSILLIFSLLQAVSLYYYNDTQWIGMIFIFLFFGGNSFITVFLSYGTSMNPDKIESDLDPGLAGGTFDEFCKQNDISPRESEIIREICNGLSNKEISEKLFISLQTVKDHTHRIYIKTNVRSRLQLMHLVRRLG
jgi:DNA-binding CsgD family transcriptional regulator